MALKIGTKVKIINVPPKYAKPNCTNIDGSIGIIEKYYPDQKQYAVSIQGAWNEASSNGLYWLHSDSIEVIDKNGGINIMGNKLTGYKYVAIVNLVDYQTIGQYTGMTDKNGKMIFKGDILQYEWGGKKNIDYIEYSGNMFTYSECIRFSLSDDEVIGNIHDNPEILKNSNP